MDRSLSDSWTGFTRFTFFNERLPKGYMWSKERLTNIQATTRPDHWWPEIWSGMSMAAQRREKQQWAIEKPKLDSARKLRSIYFLDPCDKELAQRNHEKRAQEVGIAYGSSYALQAEDVPAQGNLQRIQRNPNIKACMHRKKLMSPTRKCWKGRS